jgi:predicted dehydrogenase
MHVLTEKPIALTLEAAEAMISASRKAGRKLSVVFNRRFNTIFDECRQRLPRLGSPLIYNTQEIRSIRPKLSMHSRSGNGGPVIDCCVHDFDLLLHLSAKRDRSMRAAMSLAGTKLSCGRSDLAVDTAHINVEFETGTGPTSCMHGVSHRAGVLAIPRIHGAERNSSPHGEFGQRFNTTGRMAF